MVITRTGSGIDIDKMDEPTADELKDQVQRITAKFSSAEKENNVLKQQIEDLMESNKALAKSVDELKRANTVGNHDQTIERTPNNDQSVDSNLLEPAQTVVSNDSNSNANLNLVNGILSHFETLQISIVMTTYDSERGNPAEFVEKIEKYYRRKKIKDEQKLLIIEDALMGRARLWYEARLSPFIGYDHFKSVFLSEFYSIEARMKIKTEWGSRKFRSQDRSLVEYFNEQVRMTKYISPRLDDYEVNYTIIKQLPQRARDALATADYAQTPRDLKLYATFRSQHVSCNYSLF